MRRMPARASRRNDVVAPVRPRAAHRFALWLFGSALLALAILLALFFADVRFGQGYFFIRYSPIAAIRLSRIAPVLIIGALACGSVWALAQPQRVTRGVGFALFLLAMFGAGAWVWWAPPQPMNQQAFNMQSFSTDGAFVFEASKIDSIRKYLREFPTVTLHKGVDVMGGTRVLSNPPLTTVIAHAIRRAFGAEAGAPPGGIEQLLLDAGVMPENATELASGIRMSFVLCGLWSLSGVAAYALGRVFCCRAGAAAFAFVLTFNPCTVHFSPGKDPAQLLTINLALWAWFAAWKRKSLTLATFAGAILTVGSTAGLVHIWVGVTALAATLWQAWRADALKRLGVNIVAAAIGAATVCAIAYVTLDWNVPVTLWAVQRRWSGIQKTFPMNRAIWYAIGLPMFLLFLAPGFWTLLGLRVSRPRVGFGTLLTICTALTLLIIYAPLGVTYELPRLWIAFLSPLTLGLAIDRPLFARGVAPHGKAIRALVLIVAVQFAFTAVHWTLFDARESEFRLTTNRFFT
jgi:hypothetical protein